MITDLVASTQIAQIPVAALPTFPASAFSTTNIKPPLGASFTYFPDISLLVQKSTDVFVMDVHERRMMADAPAAGQYGTTGKREEWNDSRVVVEVIKNRTGVRNILAGVAYHMANFLPGVMCSLPQLGSCFTQYAVYST